MQIYIGPSRTRVVENQDIERDLAVGMLVAVQDVHASFPRIGKVTVLPTRNAGLDSPIQVMWFQQERASHKPQWLRFFKQTTHTGTVQMKEIILYDFLLTQKGALKKQSRDYLKQCF